MTMTDVRENLAPSPPRRGFYSPALEPDDRLAYELALDLPGVDDEIAFLRMELLHLASHDPHNTRLSVRIVMSIDKLMRTRRLLQADQEAPPEKADRIAPILASLLGDNPSPASTESGSKVCPKSEGSPTGAQSPSTEQAPGEPAAPHPALQPQLLSTLLATSPHGGPPHFSHGISPRTLRMKAKRKKHSRRR